MSDQTKTETKLEETTMLNLEIMLDDKPEFCSGTPTEVVDYLNNTAMQPTPDRQHYMDRYAHYCKMVQGHEIRTNSPVAFVEDMLRCGHARIVAEIPAAYR